VSARSKQKNSVLNYEKISVKERHLQSFRILWKAPQRVLEKMLPRRKLFPFKEGKEQKSLRPKRLKLMRSSVEVARRPQKSFSKDAEG
jgi:hypothetical protein